MTAGYGTEEDSDSADEKPKYHTRIQPTESQQFPGKRDFIDNFFTYVNKDLFICKLFYFFFFAAFGSLFPLLAVYFKQLGMSATQSGILIGFRPFLEFCSAPLWGGFADKWKKWKQLFMFSIFSWIVFLACYRSYSGSFFSAPAITFADAVTLNYLGEDTNNYGKQRMFGSLGWALSMFFVGLVLDHSTTFPNHPCEVQHYAEKNYTDDMVADAVGKPGVSQFPLDDAQPFWTSWFKVFRLLGTYKYLSVLFLAWFMGFGIGLIFTFLFWYLQDLGGSPTLFGVASVINHISELLAYFLSSRFIIQFGHINVLYAGLVGNIVRFFYISWLPNPWWVLPFEFLQGEEHPVPTTLDMSSCLDSLLISLIYVSLYLQAKNIQFLPRLSMSRCLDSVTNLLDLCVSLPTAKNIQFLPRLSMSAVLDSVTNLLDLCVSLPTAKTSSSYLA
ncbi:hypothetical protein ScPMuIL_012951 [Solemya velum]